MMHWRNFIVVSLIVIINTTNVHTQEYSVIDFAKYLDSRNPGTENKFENIFRELFNSSETLNFVLEQTFDKAKDNNFLKDLNLKFKTFQYDTVSAIGLTYSFQKAIKTSYMNSSSASSSGLNFSLHTNGNIAFIKKNNPNDFLKSGISLSYFISNGGAAEITDALSDSLTQIEIKLSNYTNIDSLNNSPLWKNYLNLVYQYLSTQLFFDFSLQANLESNQDFTMKNYVYSANLGIDIKAWNRNSTLAQLNILDWPFAIARWLTGTDDNISPLGSSFPTLLFNISYVDPSSDPLRKSLNETKKYPRFGFEAAFKTLVSRTLGGELFASADLRYFKEFGASQVIGNFNLDNSFYFVIELRQEDGFFVSYTTGNLPYDLQTNDVYAIGFNYNF